MGLTDTLLTIAILLAIAILGYLKMTKKTITDFIKEIREMTKSQKEEITDIK